MIEILTSKSADLLDGHRLAINGLFQQRYGAQPWNESTSQNEKAVNRLMAAARLPDTRTAVALDDKGSLIGLGQGGPGDIFLADLQGVAPHLTDGLKAPVFELWQLAVMEERGGQGYGCALHDAVMADVKEPALLLTHPRAVAASTLYARRGWVNVARICFGAEHPRDIWLRRG